MPADDAILAAVRNALVKDGWTITDDPYTIKYGRDKLYADLAAEKVIAASRGLDQVAVEIKSFLSPSVIYDFEQAVGQFILYRTVMGEVDPDRRLILGLSDRGYAAVAKKASAVLVLERQSIPLLIVSLDTEEVVRWIR